MGTVTFENVDEFEAEAIASSLQDQIAKMYQNQLDVLVDKDLDEQARENRMTWNDKHRKWLEKIKAKYKYTK